MSQRTRTHLYTSGPYTVANIRHQSPQASFTELCRDLGPVVYFIRRPDGLIKIGFSDHALGQRKRAAAPGMDWTAMCDLTNPRLHLLSPMGLSSNTSPTGQRSWHSPPGHSTPSAPSTTASPPTSPSPARSSTRTRTSSRRSTRSGSAWASPPSLRSSLRP